MLMFYSQYFFYKSLIEILLNPQILAEEGKDIYTTTKVEQRKKELL